MYQHEPNTYVVWRRSSTEPHLDGYVAASTYRPDDDRLCRFEVLFETQDWHQARHRILLERVGDDIAAHREADCFLCWIADQS
ncbi:hypothetical protein NONI108955_01165 [Nocardia ninae]|uniref:Uncharacterized protein n=1 Tax=Nocardia ninae NBRC 108245 TaxID=1210091 RepID=A0A511MC79_9NOCA|nr:hypothetical protein [Nocardia ninae]GEM38189.1 hypothetical protein NN4_27080 [Nocardia ninae NBRC 108245]